MKTRKEFIVHNGPVSLHCISLGSELSRMPLLIIPGLANDAESVVQYWADPPARPTVVVSLRGRGKSSSPSTGYTLNDQTEDVIAVIRELGWKKFYLFGHSVGATVGLHAVPKLQDKIAGIIIGDFAPFYPPLDKNWEDHMLRQKDQALSETAIRGLVRDAAYQDVAKDIKDCKFPILLLKGGTEFSAIREKEVEKMIEFFPTLQVKVLKDSGHEIIMESATDVMREIEEFAVN